MKRIESKLEDAIAIRADNGATVYLFNDEDFTRVLIHDPGSQRRIISLHITPTGNGNPNVDLCFKGTVIDSGKQCITTRFRTIP